MLSAKQISDIILLLENAGSKIRKIYYSNEFNIKIKEDNSPVTLADMASDKIIKAGLVEITPGIPVFSEETKEIDFEIRSGWNPLWILDPLDGTKEFIAKNNEFCISLALVFDKQPVAGFIHAPVTSETWIAVRGEGAFKYTEGEKIRLPFLTPSGTYRINISRSHHSEKEAAWIETFCKQNDAVTAIYGSAIKFCKIAEGISDIYPKFSLIHEWDIAAGHLIIEEAGGKIIETQTLRPPVYNKEEYFQPPFIAFGSRVKNWQRWM
ncbi:MAG: 3'(2'),5'-bisphosphate nucleotidase [Odoribacter sp.]|nr:3'(2'),5'-bisphosphate nucleotidase [Odoribacter sp.]